MCHQLGKHILVKQILEIQKQGNKPKVNPGSDQVYGNKTRV